MIYNILMKSFRIVPYIGIGAAVLLLIVMALQYPLSVTFPIGPDAPAHIRDALKLTKEYPGDSSGVAILMHSPYPVSILLLNITRVLPIPWADRFTWWMATGHIAVGMALGLFVYRIHSWQAATIAMSIWAPLTMVFNNHIASGTLPQLWSLAFLLLFLERFAARSVIPSIILLLIATASHPITAVLIILTLLIVLPSYWLNWKHFDIQERRLLQIITGVLLIIGGYLAYAYIIRGPLRLFWDGPNIEFQKLLMSEIAPWLLLGIPGWIILQSAAKMRPMALGLFNTLGLLTLALAINEQFGVDIWTYRFRSTLIIVTIVGISIGLLHIVRLTFQSAIARGIFITALLICIVSFSWQKNAMAYARHEKDIKHNDIAAMTWMQELPEDSFITSTNKDRTSEWIPLYSKRRYVEINPSNQLLSLHGDGLTAYLSSIPYTHIAIFLRREPVPENFGASPQVFIPVYEKDEVAIFEIRR